MEMNLDRGIFRSYLEAHYYFTIVVDSALPAIEFAEEVGSAFGIPEYNIFPLSNDLRQIFKRSDLKNEIYFRIFDYKSESDKTNNIRSNALNFEIRKNGILLDGLFTSSYYEPSGKVLDWISLNNLPSGDGEYEITIYDAARNSVTYNVIIKNTPIKGF
jgi:hypothetical protein